MTIVNKDTQKAQHMIKAYNFYKNKNNGENLFSIYKNYSDKKYKALCYCKSLMRDLDGFASCFCGHNTDYFTYAFLFKKDNKTYLAYITYANDYMIEYD